MLIIENYVKKLPLMKVKGFNDYKYGRRCKNSFEIKFPNLRHLEYLYYSYVFEGCEELDEIVENLETTQLEDKFIYLMELIDDKIKIIHHY